MAEIEISGDRLIVHVSGMERAMALKSRLEVPLDPPAAGERSRLADDRRGGRPHEAPAKKRPRPGRVGSSRTAGRIHPR